MMKDLRDAGEEIYRLALGNLSIREPKAPPFAKREDGAPATHFCPSGLPTH